MIADVDVSVPASLIGDPTRAAFLTALSEGQPLSAGELARRAGVTASTASIQLAKLVEAGLLSVEPNGRHRYYSLDDPALAAALEALALIAPVKPARSLKQAQIGAALQSARTCYDHLAGALGVTLFDALIRKRVLTDELEVTTHGAARLRKLGIDVDGVARGRRPLARRCLDWSERRDHLAGALGAAVATRFFELGWIERMTSSRAVRVTQTGREALARELGVTAE